MVQLKKLEDIFFYNLVKKGGKRVWEILQAENMAYMGEAWEATAERVWEDWEEILNSLPQQLREWTVYQMEEQTDIWQSIQTAWTSYNSLGQYLIIKNIINTRDWSEEQLVNLSKYIGYTWHFLYMEH